MARWNGFRSVLCPVDFSEHSRLALRYAEALALRGNGELKVTYANEPILVAAASMALRDKDMVKRSGDQLEAFVNGTLAAGWRTRLRVTSQVSVGNAADQILKATGRRKADLVVLGTHGLTGADRFLMGSTTLSVLQRTTIPVLAIPRRGRAPKTALPTSWPGRRIVAPLELDEMSAKDADAAARLAEWFGSSLLLLHVVGRIATPAWLRGDLSAHDRIRLAEAQQLMEELAALTRRRVKTEARVICGAVSDEIAALAAAERTGLVVTTLRDRAGWFGARRGSVSYHVLSHAFTPVLACPPGWRPR